MPQFGEEATIYHPWVVTCTTPALQFGKDKEMIALHKFTAQCGIPVISTGVLIDVQNGFLAASPDGNVQLKQYFVYVFLILKTFQVSLVLMV